MVGQKWAIYWNEYSSDTYLYGSKLSFNKRDDVEFENLLMPPGTIIKQWYSKTNFQMQKIEPSLPMIDGESSYRIILNVDIPDGENIMGRLLFFDRYNMEAGSVFLRDKVTEFRCPLKTYSYSLQLINGGVTHLHFHSIEIQEIIDEPEEDDKKTE